MLQNNQIKEEINIENTFPLYSTQTVQQLLLQNMMLSTLYFNKMHNVLFCNKPCCNIKKLPCDKTQTGKLYNLVTVQYSLQEHFLEDIRCTQIYLKVKEFTNNHGYKKRS